MSGLPEALDIWSSLVAARYSSQDYYELWFQKLGTRIVRKLQRFCPNSAGSLAELRLTNLPVQLALYL